jgi:hypothetical protein
VSEAGFDGAGILANHNTPFPGGIWNDSHLVPRRELTGPQLSRITNHAKIHRSIKALFVLIAHVNRASHLKLSFIQEQNAH